MNQQLDLSLPQSPRKSRAGAAGWLVFLLTLGNLALLIVLVLSAQGRSAGGANGDPVNSPESLKQLAETLERRTLYSQAAEVWKEYAEVAELSPQEAAGILYLRGKNLQLAGSYLEAARYLSQYEGLSSTLVSREDRRRAARLISDCLFALDKVEAQEQFVKAYTSLGVEEQGTVIARVAGDPITLGELRAALARQALSILRMRGAPLGPEEARQQAEEMARQQLEKTEVLQQALQQLVRTKVLYREALARQYAEEKRTVEDLAELRRNYLADRLIQDHIEEVAGAITRTDLENHYAANKESYIEKPSVEFSQQKFATEAAAREALAALDGSQFEKGAGPAVTREPLPGLGRSAEATAHLLALDEGRSGDRPIRIGDAWYIFRCDRKHPRRQKTFEEAEPQVRADLLLAKQREALERLQGVLAQKYRVEILSEAIEKATREDANDGAPDATAGPGQTERGGNPAVQDSPHAADPKD